MRSGETLAGAGPTDQTRDQGAAREAPRWSAIVLAGERAEPDPLSRSFGVPLKALIPLGGEPMIAHVLRTLADCPSIGRILIVTQEPGALTTAIGQAPAIEIAAGREGIADSVALHAGTEEMPWPVLVTTADHPLLTVEMVEHFLAASAGWDATIGVVERSVLLGRYPSSRRTWLRFRGGAFTGANLFALRGPRVSAGLRTLARAERDRKHQLKLLWRFGPILAAGALVRALSLKQAVAIGGRRLGIAAAAVALPFAEAGIDVDRIEDHRTAARILADRAGQAEIRTRSSGGLG